MAVQLCFHFCPVATPGITAIPYGNFYYAFLIQGDYVCKTLLEKSS